MVDPADVPRILSDAARLLGAGDLVVFGSAALALRIPGAPTTRDVDVWCEPPERGALVEALMGELSWYQDKHGAYVEVWGPETFCAPSDWRDRAQRLRNDDAPGVTLVVPHPHDVLFAKLERGEPSDHQHISLVLSAAPMSQREFDRMAARSPYRDGRIVDAGRVERFEFHADFVRRRLPP